MGVIDSIREMVGGSPESTYRCVDCGETYEEEVAVCPQCRGDIEVVE